MVLKGDNANARATQQVNQRRELLSLVNIHARLQSTADARQARLAAGASIAPHFLFPPRRDHCSESAIDKSCSPVEDIHDAVVLSTSSLEAILKLVEPTPPTIPSPAALLGDEALACSVGLAALSPSAEERIMHWQRLCLIARLAAQAMSGLWSTSSVLPEAGQHPTSDLAAPTSTLHFQTGLWRWGDGSVSSGIGPQLFSGSIGPSASWLRNLASSILARWDKAVDRLDIRPALQFQSLVSLLDHTLRRGAAEASRSLDRADNANNM